MARAISVKQLLSTRRRSLEFEGVWLGLIGQPEVKGSMIIWGESGQGKTSFALQFARYIARFEKVIYNSLEEGDSLSMEIAVRRESLMDVNGRVLFLDKEPIDELIERLDKSRSANVVIIDSLQYSGLQYEQYKGLIEKYRNKLFVFISHAEGREPSNRVATQIKYDAHIKVRVEGFRAYCTSRYGGGEAYVISRDKLSDLTPQ